MSRCFEGGIPATPFFIRWKAASTRGWGAWARSDTVFTSVLDHYRQGTQGYTDPAAEQALYYLARGRMVARQYTVAIRYLWSLEVLSARLDDDTYFKVMGRLQQGLAYDVLGRRARAVKHYKQVLDMKEWGDSHALARSYLERPYGSSW